MNCPDPCGKVRYSDRYRALLGSIHVVMLGGPSSVPYRANACGCWHLTAHKKGKARTGNLVRKVEAFRDQDETREQIPEEKG